MSDTYYQYRDAKVNIAHRLMKMDGWKVYGYYADNSDPYTDYYDPASWSGIATKNGFTLVIDKSRAEEEYTRTYTVYTDDAQPAEIREKIAKLERMTQENGASAQEEETARAAIAKLQEKKAEGTTTKTDYTPGHLANPPRCNWHIEKDGIILDKGTGLLKFADVVDISGYTFRSERNIEEWQKFNNLTREEWEADYMKCEIWGSYPTADDARHAWEKAQKDYSLLDQFNALIARFNNVCGGMVGNSGEAGYTYEMQKITKYRKAWKFEPTTSGSFKDGQCFKLVHNFNYGCFSGTVYRFKSAFNGENVHAERVSMKSGKSLTGNANASNSFGYYTADGNDDTRKRNARFNKWIEQGAIIWGDVVEVSEPYEVEKCVKVPIKATKTEEKTEEKTELQEEAKADYIIKADTDTRDGSALWVVKLSALVDRAKFEEIREEMKKNGGYYSKFKKGFIFRFDPTELLTA